MPVLASATFLCASTDIARGDYLYHVDIDTSSVYGINGALGFQLATIQPYSNSQSLSAQITNFANDKGTVGDVSVRTGQASGRLPGSILLSYSSEDDVLFQDITYGNAIHFDLNFSGGALGNGSSDFPGAFFYLSTIDANLKQLLTTDPTGTLLEIDINSDGSFNIVPYPPDYSGTSLVTVTPAVSPEPTSMIPFGIGMMTLAGYTLYRQSRRQ